MVIQSKNLILNTPIFFCSENVVCWLHLLHIFKCPSDYIFSIEVNNMIPDQTAPPKEQSDLGPYCLQYRLPKNISRQEEQTANIVG